MLWIIHFLDFSVLFSYQVEESKNSINKTHPRGRYKILRVPDNRGAGALIEGPPNTEIPMETNP
jgi:hypothetical protein